MKYPEYVIENKNGRIILITDIHNCHIEWYKTQNDDRMQQMCDALKKEYTSKEYDCILALGDYSLDFWYYGIGGSYLHNPPVSRTEEFVQKYASQFPVTTYMLPGNHEQYGESKWKEITGREREFCLVYGEYVFVMMDTFAGLLDPKENSDGVYSGMNVDFLREVLEAHPEKKIILCAHYFDIEKESEDIKEIIVREKRIQCVFVGHMHISSTVLLDESWRNLPVIFCGNYSYHLTDKSCGQWGYRILNLDGGPLRTNYIQVNNEVL